MEIKTFFDPATYTLTYVVFDPTTKDAVVIDPVLDYDPLGSTTSTQSVREVESFLREQDLHLRYILETHAHADHLTAAQYLKRRFECPVVIGHLITEVQKTFKTVFDLDDVAIDGSQFDRLVKTDDTLDAGTLKIHVLETPGHTPACVSYLIDDAVFTGDALFIEDYGTGRCDIPIRSDQHPIDGLTLKPQLQGIFRVLQCHRLSWRDSTTCCLIGTHASPHPDQIHTLQLRYLLVQEGIGLGKCITTPTQQRESPTDHVIQTTSSQAIVDLYIGLNKHPPHQFILARMPAIQNHALAETRHGLKLHLQHVIPHPRNILDT